MFNVRRMFNIRRMLNVHPIIYIVNHSKFNLKLNFKVDYWMYIVHEFTVYIVQCTLHNILYHFQQMLTHFQNMLRLMLTHFLYKI